MSLFSRPRTKVKDTEGDEEADLDEDDDLVSIWERTAATANKEETMTELKQGISKRVANKKVQSSSGINVKLEKSQSTFSALHFEM